jgi:hypothetical protein
MRGPEPYNAARAVTAEGSEIVPFRNPTSFRSDRENPVTTVT